MSFRGKCYRGKNLGENVTKGKTLQGKMLQGKMFQGKTAFPHFFGDSKFLVFHTLQYQLFVYILQHEEISNYAVGQMSHRQK